jgi:uncharacterized LabA/DUF88 family protein
LNSCRLIPRGDAQMALPNKTMIFIDGENLVLRYQEMIEQGNTPDTEVKHEKDVYVWHDRIVKRGMMDVIRVNYYTSYVGDNNRRSEITKELKQIRYKSELAEPLKHSGLEGYVYPKLFKKTKGRSSKGVDINITIDALSHTLNDNTDIVYLVTGDGDYLPLIKEIIRSGKRVCLGALSSGLNPTLSEAADYFFDLDNCFFTK